MGHEMAKVLAVRGGGLSGNAYKVLNVMCHTALDRPNDKGQRAGLYWAGWEPLAAAIRRPAGAGDPAPTEKQTRSTAEGVRRAINELEAEGIIQRLDRAHSGTRQVYRIVIDALFCPNETLGQKPQQNVGADSNETLGQKPQQNVGESPNKTLGPNNKKEQRQDLLQDTTGSAAISGTDRAHEAPQSNPEIDHRRRQELRATLDAKAGAA